MDSILLLLTPILISGGLFFFLKLTRRPELGIWPLGFSLIFMGFDVGRLPFLGIGVDFLDLTLLLIISALLLRSLSTRRLIQFRFQKLFFILLLFLAVAIGSTAITADLNQSMRALLRYSFAIAMLAILLGLIRERKHIWWLAYGFILGGVAAASIGIVGSMAANFLHIDNRFVVDGGGQFLDFRYRAKALNTDPNLLSGYLAPVCLLAFLLTVRTKSHLMAAATAITAIGILLTFSRGGWMAILIGMAVVWFYHRQGFHRLVGTTVKSALILLVIALALIPLFNAQGKMGQLVEAIQHRSSTLTASGLEGSSRFFIWKSALVAISANPIMGIGVGAFKAAHPHYVVDGDTHPHSETHNMYLDVVTGVGVAGSVFFFYFLWYVLRRGHRALQRLKNGPQGPEYSLAVAAFASFVSLLTLGVTINLSTYRYFWVIIALILALEFYSRAVSARAKSMSAEVEGQEEDARIPQSDQILRPALAPQSPNFRKAGAE